MAPIAPIAVPKRAFPTDRMLSMIQRQPLQIDPVCIRTLHLAQFLHKHWIHAQYGFVVGRRNVARCSGVETSNANISFPEHFEGKRQSAEMYQKDCLPLLSTFCKFQRLKVKGSQVMLVCLHQPRRSGNVDDDQTSTMCWLSSDSQKLLCGSHTYICV